MANLTYTSDIKKDVLHRCGEMVDGTSEYDSKVLEDMNYWYQCIIAGATELNIECGEPWWWARAKYPGVLNLQPYYTTGYVTVTHDSTTVTFNPAPVASLKDWYLKVEGKAEYFRLAAHTAGSATATLDGAYTDDSGTVSFICYKLDYELPAGIMRLAAPFRIYRRQSPFADDTGQVDGIDKMTLDRDYPLHRILQGIPDRFAVTYLDPNGVYRIRFNRIPYFECRVEYDYIPVPVVLTTSPIDRTPIIPPEHRKILSYAATYYLMIDKNDNRAPEYRELTKASLEALVQSSRRMKENLQKDMGRLIPRRDMTHYTRRYFSQEVQP